MELIKLKPCFRSGYETPWGGDRLRELPGKEDAPACTGESLEVSALKGRESVAVNGKYAGLTLSRILDDSYASVVGTDVRPFPLLLKLLDAKNTLSVQVHPGDEYALKNEGKKGKTEAWVILAAESGARLAYGLKPGADIAEAVKNGKTEEALNFVEPHPGDVYYIPHGCVHAMGGGIMVYEIQQSSDVTYRLYDWNRTGNDGKPRQLHIKQALEVVRPLKNVKCEGVEKATEGGSVTSFICDENFSLMRLNINGTMKLKFKYMAFVTPLECCSMGCDENELELKPFETVLVPACCKNVWVKGRLNALVSTLPDIERLQVV